MKNYIQKKQSGGFTIIEVMIVLAVAGLIMLIVFLAVPALQRNSRNTQMRSDAASVLAGVNEFITNNNGSLPTTASVPVEGSGDVVITGAAGSNPTDAKVRSGITIGWAADFDDPSNPAGANITVRMETICNSSGTAAINSSGQAFAATFSIEGASGNIGRCIQR